MGISSRERKRRERSPGSGPRAPSRAVNPREPSPPPAPPLSALLANPFYVRVWLAGSLTNSMRWLEIIVSSVTTFELTGSGFAVALVASMRAWPMLFAGALAGVIAEGIERRRLLPAGQLLMMVSTAASTPIAAMGVLAAWHLAVGGLGTGLVWATDMAVRRRLLADLSGDGLVARGVALDTVSNSVTRMIGPILGGIALETIGVAAAFGVAALCHVISFAIALPVVAAQEMRKLAVRGLPRDVAEAAQIAFSNRTLLVALIGTTLMNLFGFSYTAIVPVWGVESFNASPAVIGLLAAAEPAGSLIGGMLIAMRPLPWRPVVVFTVGTSVFIGSVGLAALSPIFAIAWLILAVGGVGSAAFGTMQTLLVMTHTPVEARSRVMGLVTTCIGLGPAGSLALGGLSDSIGPAAALVLMASIGLAGMALITRRGVD